MATTTPEVDEGLYSRQLYVYGHEAQKQMSSANILIVGLRGLGIEVAKNVVLAGVRSVSILDNDDATYNDLGSQFYLTEDDVTKKVSRSKGSIHNLSTLNPYVDVKIVTRDLDETLISQYNVIVLTNATLSLQKQVNIWCRAHNVKCIIADTHGLLFNVFVDNGPTHTIRDADGNQPLRGIISHVSNSNPMIITCGDDVRHGLSTGDHITFEDLEGLEDVLNATSYPIKFINQYSFSIPVDGTNLPSYTGTRGHFNQVKVPFDVSFNTLDESLQTLPFSNDFMGTMPYYHALVLALSRYREENKGQYPLSTSYQQQHTVYTYFEEELSKLPTGGYKIDSDSQRAIYYGLIRAASTSLSPICSIAGGIVGQEVLKSVSGKFTPIQQFFYYAAPEVFPDRAFIPTDDASLEPYKPIDGSRYADYHIALSRDVHTKLTEQKLFLVGAGAIGCEMLKNWAMMGVATADTGHVTITDMDTIEKSNLNRQFLFRPSDVGKLKSQAAATAAQAMNPSIHITAQSLKLGPETESTYNDEFWNNLSGVYTALDNVDTRLYCDAKCVYYKKPMVDSGTLGTAGNTQVVIPYLTESYASTRDPPEQGIPICTLKNFPYRIEHTIQWARDIFEGDFTQAVNEVNQYLNNDKQCIKKLREQPNTLVSTLQIIQKRLVGRPTSFAQCITWARDRFEEEYHNKIAELLVTFPHDALTTEGTPFWAGNKRPPSVLHFDPDDPTHMSYIIAAANLYAANYHIKGHSNVDDIKDVLLQHNVPQFTAKAVKVAVTEEEAAKMNDSTANTTEVDYNIEAQRIIDTLPPSDTLIGLKLQPAEFEKDDDTNYHIAYITACSNLRARNYQIKEESAHMTKFIAGKIIPAIATTTALVTGMVCIEMCKVVQGNDAMTIEQYRSTFVTLATNIFAPSEPVPPSFTETVFPNGKTWKWSLWDTYEIDIPDTIPTVNDIISLVKESYGDDIELACVIYGTALLYMNFSADEGDMALPLPDLVHKVTGNHVDLDASQYIVCELSLDGPNGEEIIIPPARIRVKH